MIHVPSEIVAPISPWTWGSEEVTMEVSRVTIDAPIVPAITAIQARRSVLGSSVGALACAISATRIDGRGHRQAGQQRRLHRRIALDPDADRHALDDLGE